MAERWDCDGSVAGPWLTAPGVEWDWNEGPCPCGGIMRWAEAGYVPWHRICDRCGEHWDLHLIRIQILRYSGGWPGEQRVVAYRLPNGDVVSNIDDVWARGYTEDDVSLVCETREDFPPGVVFVANPGSGYAVNDNRVPPSQRGAAYQLVVEEGVPMAAEVVRMVRPEHLTPKVIQRGMLYGGWARRTRC